MSDEDKDKYVSTEEATGENEQLSSDQFDMDKAPSQIKDFLLKHYRNIVFLYFVGAFISFLVTNSPGGNIELLYERTASYGSRYYAGEDVFIWLWVFSPLIIFMVWKKIFHPKD